MNDLHATLREGLQALGECDPRQLDPAGIVIRAACEWKCAEIAEQLVEQDSCGTEARQVLAKARKRRAIGPYSAILKVWGPPPSRQRHGRANE